MVYMNYHTRSLSFVISIVFLALSGIVKAEDVSSDKLPFVPTKIVNNQFATDTKWYTMTIRAGKMLTASETQITCNETTVIEKENLWCFVEKSKGRYAVYNLAMGADRVAYCSSSANKQKVVMQSSADASASGTNVFALSINGDGYSFYYPNYPNACWNDYASVGALAIWNNGAAPNEYGCRIKITEYDAKEFLNKDVTEKDLQPVNGDILYVKMRDGSVDAYPLEYVETYSVDANGLKVVDKDGIEHTYGAADIESYSTTCPVEFPTMESFSFDAASNDMLMENAAGTISSDNNVSLSVGSIGKRLYPTFTLSEEDGVAYINGKPCESKKTSHRFAESAVCTVSYPQCNMLRQPKTGSYIMYPFGRDYIIDAKFLCDNPTTEYGVPVIRINTNDGTMISSKDYYWDATIEIDGAGYFPDLKKTDVQIKGRGNTSWNGNIYADPKNPYRLKFPSKKKVLGMTSAKSWVLIANAQKGSMLCNMIGSRAAEMVECAAANHFIPVELYINGDYRGSYNLTEKVGFAKNSIVVSDETTAALVELDSYYDEVYKFRSSKYNLPVNIKEPDFADPESTSLVLSDVQNSFNRFVNEVYSHGDIAKYADIKYLARFFFLNELVLNFEIMHPKSTYCYNGNVKDENSKFIFGPVWDFDWGFGYEVTRTYFECRSDIDLWSVSPMSGKAFINDVRFSGDKFNRQYYRIWHDFYTNHLDELLEYIEDYYNVVKYSYEHDNQKRKLGGLVAYNEHLQNAKKWLANRAKYVYNHLSNDLGYKDKDYLIVDDPDDEPTEIEMMRQENRSFATGVYDLFGRRLSSDINSLPKGFYVIEGRKVVKR